MACYITGEYPIEVFCQGTAFNPQLKEVGDVDSIVVILRFPSGVIASIDNHRNAGLYLVRYENGFV
jgi:myo-inositol 2-dehydrogenase/D-chiro-inositol 1-dehydrogenase